MDRRFKWISLSLAVAATVLNCPSTEAQHHQAGYTRGDYGASALGPTEVASSSCSSCERPGHGWGRHGGGLGLRQGSFGNAFKTRIDELKAYNKRGYDRNQAWPKPFNCADRQLYFSIWEPMLTTGFQANCVFSETHFDPKTHQLNKFGQSKIAGIFRNHPVGQKVALVQNSAPADVVNARLLAVQSTIDQWYGRENFQQIAVVNQFPSGFSGARVQALNQKSMEELPPPIISVSSGDGSTNDTGVGQ